VNLGWLDNFYERMGGSARPRAGGLPASANVPGQYPPGASRAPVYAPARVNQPPSSQQRRNAGANRGGGVSPRYGLPASASRPSEYPMGVAGRTMPGLPASANVPGQYPAGVPRGRPAAGPAARPAAARSPVPAGGAPAPAGGYTPMVTPSFRAREEQLVSAGQQAGLKGYRPSASWDKSSESFKAAAAVAPTVAAFREAGAGAAVPAVIDQRSQEYGQRADIQAWMNANRNAPKGADGMNIVDRFIKQQRPPQGVGAMPLSAKAQALAVSQYAGGADPLVTPVGVPGATGLALPGSFSPATQAGVTRAWQGEGPDISARLAAAANPAAPPPGTSVGVAPQQPPVISNSTLTPEAIRQANLIGNRAINEGRQAQAINTQQQLVETPGNVPDPGEDFLNRFQATKGADIRAAFGVQ
jgi:hypothetical protein